MAADGTGERLMAALLANDPGAVERLYDTCARRAYGLAYQLVGDRGEAEDVVQEAFVALWQHARQLDPSRGRLVPLLLTIVHHKAIDHLRRRPPLPAFMSEDLAAGDVDPGEAAILTDHRQRLDQALAGLPRDQRRTLELAYYVGYSHSEIARAMSTPLGTVKSRLRIALQRLRIVLGDRVGA